MKVVVKNKCPIGSRRKDDIVLHGNQVMYFGRAGLPVFVCARKPVVVKSRRAVGDVGRTLA